MAKKKQIKRKLPDGGEIKAISPEDAAISKVLMERNRGKNFVDRAFDYKNAPIIPTNSIPGNDESGKPYSSYPNSQHSSHLMATDWGEERNGVFPGPYRVYPEIVQKPGQSNLTYLGGDKSYDYADESGEYIQAPTQHSADILSSYGYKKATGIPTYEEGGNMNANKKTPKKVLNKIMPIKADGGISLPPTGDGRWDNPHDTPMPPSTPNPDPNADERAKKYSMYPQPPVSPDSPVGPGANPNYPDPNQGGSQDGSGSSVNWNWKPNSAHSGNIANIDTAQAVANGMQMISAMLPNTPKQSHQKMLSYGYNPSPNGDNTQAIYEDGGSVPGMNFGQPQAITAQDRESYNRYRGALVSAPGRYVRNWDHNEDFQKETAQKMGWDYSKNAAIQADMQQRSQSMPGSVQGITGKDPWGGNPNWEGSRESNKSYTEYQYDHYDKNNKLIGHLDPSTEPMTKDQMNGWLSGHYNQQQQQQPGANPWMTNDRGISMDAPQSEIDKLYQPQTPTSTASTSSAPSYIQTKPATAMAKPNVGGGSNMYLPGENNYSPDAGKVAVNTPGHAGSLEGCENDLNSWTVDKKNYGQDERKFGGAIAKSGIHIKPENKGKFTAYKKRTGKTTAEALHSKDPHVRKMANFARNASHFKHENGGSIEEFGDGGKWETNNKATISEQQIRGVSAPPQPTFEGHRLTPTPYESESDKQIRELRERQANTPAIGAKATWQQKVKNSAVLNPGRYLPSGALQDVVGTVADMAVYPGKAATNLTQPSQYFQGADGNSQAGAIGFGNMMMDIGAVAAPFMKGRTPIEEPPNGGGFPASYIRNNPTGGTRMPTLTEGIDPRSLTKEQQILQSYGLDPNKSKLPDYFNHIINRNGDPIRIGSDEANEFYASQGLERYSQNPDARRQLIGNQYLQDISREGKSDASYYHKYEGYKGNTWDGMEVHRDLMVNDMKNKKFLSNEYGGNIGSYKAGQEVDLSEAQIKHLKSLGYGIEVC